MCAAARSGLSIHCDVNRPLSLFPSLTEGWGAYGVFLRTSRSEPAPSLMEGRPLGGSAWLASSVAIAVTEGMEPGRPGLPGFQRFVIVCVRLQW